MTMTAAEQEALLASHAADVNEKFNRLIDGLDADRKERMVDVRAQGETRAKITALEGYLTTVAENLKELTDKFHTPAGKTPWFAAVGAFVAVTALLVGGVVGYVTREFSHANDMSKLRDESAQIQDEIRRNGRNKLDKLQGEYIINALKGFEDETSDIWERLSQHEITLSKRGASDAAVEGRLTHTEQNFVHMDERFHGLEAEIKYLQQAEASDATQDENLHERLNEHVDKQGSAGHPAPERVIKTNGDRIGVSNTIPEAKP